MNQGYNKDKIFSDFIINEYFKDHPENILGKMEIQRTPYGLSLECIASDDDLELKLNECVNILPKNFYEYKPTKYKNAYSLLAKDSDEFIANRDYLLNLKISNYFILNDNICMRGRYDEKEGLFYTKISLNSNDTKRIKKLIALKDQFNQLILYEKGQYGDNLISNARIQLNILYDDFVKTEGFLNRDINKRVFKDDVEANKILALEKNYSAGISKAVTQKEGINEIPPSANKADIFFKRTISPTLTPKITDSKEALIASLSTTGTISISFLRDNAPKALDETLKELIEQKLIFINHEDKNNYVLNSKYLSGNVKQKYKQVKEMVENGDESLRINLESLEQILPKNLSASDISVSIGTTWIPLKYYK